MSPCRFRAVSAQLQGISRDRCHLPLANYMKLRFGRDSIPVSHPKPLPAFSSSSPIRFSLTNCHAERSEGSAFCGELQIPRFAWDDKISRKRALLPH
jgi:hypothetical protein